MKPDGLEVRVTRKTAEALDIFTYELAALDDRPLPAFSAGSHIDVYMPNGITRQYSLCNDPMKRRRYLIAVLKDPGSRGGSKAMHEEIQEGDHLSISAPRNHFPLAREAGRSLLLAGGIGVTPILCMAERLSIEEAPFEMHYCTRSPDRTAFLARIRASALAPMVHFHFDDGAAEQRIDLAQLLGSQHPTTHLYVCGPKGFMDAVLSGAREMGWAEARLHYEFFSADVVKLDGDGSFEVQLASSGRIIQVPKEQSVLQALAEAGVEVQTSCEQGVCGTCLTGVLKGEPDHRDMYLTPEEQAKNDQFLPCCSRAKSARLVLDL